MEREWNVQATEEIAVEARSLLSGGRRGEGIGKGVTLSAGAKLCQIRQACGEVACAPTPPLRPRRAPRPQVRINTGQDRGLESAGGHVRKAIPTEGASLRQQGLGLRPALEAENAHALLCA